MTDDFRPRVETDPAVMAAFDEAESRPASLENLTPRAAVRHGAAALVSVFSGSSWDTWKVVLKALYALPMSEADIAVFQQPDRAADATNHTGAGSLVSARPACRQVDHDGADCRVSDDVPDVQARAW